jgi:SWI/SNF-related matrix-associated actin-dependent regulator 1 of chromatin subfamily A
VACNSIVSRSGVQNRIALTGTPINSKVRDLFHIIKWLDPTIFPSEVKFMLKYCGLTKTDRGMNDGGAYNLNDLHTILTNTIMIRKKKSEVLTELPDKQRYIIPLELSSWLKYNKAEQGFKDWVNGHSAREQTTGLAKIEYMKQAIWEGKKKEVIKWIKNFIESTDEKLIVFGIHKKVIADLKQAMPHGSVVITGDVSNEDKQRAVDAFQNDPKVRLLLGNIEAAGVGLTLTASSTVAIVELPWTPTKVDQAIDRAHRIGQKNSVIVYFLLADKTLDRTIYTDVLGVKARAIEAAIDGKEYKQEESYLKILMDKYKRGVK